MIECYDTFFRIQSYGRDILKFDLGINTIFVVIFIVAHKNKSLLK